MADSSREYFRGGNNLIGNDNNVNNVIGGAMNGSISNAPHWGAMKPGPPVTGSYYPYEWKVEENKKQQQNKQQTRGIGTMVPNTLSTVDIKHVAQLPLPQGISQQNAWGGTGATVVATSSPDAGWSTIKWENTNTMVQKPSTINTAGLQFVSAPAQVPLFFFQNKIIFFLYPISSFISLFTIFLGLDHHNGVNLNIWQDSCYIMSYLQGLFLQVKGDIITFSLRKIVCFQLMAFKSSKSKVTKSN